MSGIFDDASLTACILAAPSLSRFRHHFSGDRATNRIDKPEWIFTYAISLVRDGTPAAASASGEAQFQRLIVEAVREKVISTHMTPVKCLQRH